MRTTNRNIIKSLKSSKKRRKKKQKKKNVNIELSEKDHSTIAFHFLKENFNKINIDKNKQKPTKMNTFYKLS